MKSDNPIRHVSVEYDPLKPDWYSLEGPAHANNMTTDCELLFQEFLTELTKQSQAASSLGVKFQKADRSKNELFS